MVRTALLLPSLFAAACTVGEVGTTNTGTDAPTKTDGGGATANGCVARLTPPGGEHPHNPPVAAGNPTNAGENCVASGCHLKGMEGKDANGAPAPAYQFGGTVYKTGGTVASAGAAIVLKGGGKTVTVYSDTAGNFGVPDDGSLPNPFLGNVTVSGCPTISTMSTQIAQNGCGGQACHIGSNPTGGKIILAD
jgi:hypothetical protein